MLRSPSYRDLSIADATRRWTTGSTKATVDASGRPIGYDLPALSKATGLDLSRPISSLSQDELHSLVQEMAMREGFSATGGSPARPAAAQPAQPAAARPNLADPNAPGISAEEQLRRKKNLEKTQAEPLPADVQKNVATINESMAALDKLEVLAKDPDVRKYIGPGMSRFWSEPRYYLGLGVSPKVNDYIQLTNYLNAQGVGPFLHGSRNEKIWAMIQSHFPKPYDDPDFALDKIRQAREIYQQNKGFELGSAGITRGEGGANAP
jgi:hypothetical protein